jgi:hypothetical protein
VKELACCNNLVTPSGNRIAWLRGSRGLAAGCCRNEQRRDGGKPGYLKESGSHTVVGCLKTVRHVLLRHRRGVKSWPSSRNISKPIQRKEAKMQRSKSLSGQNLGADAHHAVPQPTSDCFQLFGFRSWRPDLVATLRCTLTEWIRHDECLDRRLRSTEAYLHFIKITPR